jgi:hypothetical protein
MEIFPRSTSASDGKTSVEDQILARVEVSQPERGMHHDDLWRDVCGGHHVHVTELFVESLEMLAIARAPHPRALEHFRNRSRSLSVTQISRLSMGTSAYSAAGDRQRIDASRNRYTPATAACGHAALAEEGMAGIRPPNFVVPL